MRLSDLSETKSKVKVWTSKRRAQHGPGPKIWCILARGPLGAGLKDFHLPLQDHEPGNPPPSALYPSGSGGNNHGAMTTDQLQVPWLQTHRGKSKAQIAESMGRGGHLPSGHHASAEG